MSWAGHAWTGGSRPSTWYQAGHATRIVLSPGGREAGERELAARGIHVHNEAEIGRAVMTGALGLPATAVEVLPGPLDNTAHEAEAIGSRAREEGSTRLIIITSRSATRRAGYAFERVLGDKVVVIVRDTPRDPFDPAWWWRARASFRETFYEFPKLVAYWLGLGA